jgi:hypothetical protein
MVTLMYEAAFEISYVGNKLVDNNLRGMGWYITLRVIAFLDFVQRRVEKIQLLKPRVF